MEIERPIRAPFVDVIAFFNDQRQERDRDCPDRGRLETQKVRLEKQS